MSALMGGVWVLPSRAAADPERVRVALGSWLEGASYYTSGASGRWDLPGVAGASLFIRTDEAGFDLLVVRFSSSALAEDPAGTLAWIERGFEASRGLGVILGLLTLYPDHFEPAWLREHVLIPLLLEEWDALRALPFEALWLPKEA